MHLSAEDEKAFWDKRRRKKSSRPSTQSWMCCTTILSHNSEERLFVHFCIRVGPSMRPT